MARKKRFVLTGFIYSFTTAMSAVTNQQEVIFNQNKLL